MPAREWRLALYFHSHLTPSPGSGSCSVPHKAFRPIHHQATSGILLCSTAQHRAQKQSINKRNGPQRTLPDRRRHQLKEPESPKCPALKKPRQAQVKQVFFQPCYSFMSVRWQCAALRKTDKKKKERQL